MDTTLLAPEKKSPPWVDSTPLAYDPADATKQVRIDAGAIATGTTRVITMGDRDVNLAAGGTFAELVHATRHQHGGADEIATATPGANAIPKAGSGGTLASGWIPDLSGTYQPLDADLTAIAALSPANDDIIQRKSGAWTHRTLAQYKSDLALSSTDSPQFAKLGLGVSFSNAVLLRIGGTATGTTQWGSSLASTIGSDCTAGYNGYYTAPATAAASFTLPYARHFAVVNISAGSGSTVTRQAGVYIPSLTTAGTNIGIESLVTAGATNWGWYGNGTANNLTNGAWIFGEMASEPTPGTNQAAIYAYDVSGTAELKVADEAANRTQISPHPHAVMEAHDALMESVGLTPVSVPWGYESEQAAAGVRVTADIAAALRCIEWLMAEAGKPVQLIQEEQTEPTAHWDAIQASGQQRWDADAAEYDRQITRWAAQPFWVRDQFERPQPVGSRPPQKTRPTWLDRSIEKISA